jgi:DNA-binding MarR family transcriptional regulator
MSTSADTLRRRPRNIAEVSGAPASASPGVSETPSDIERLESELAHFVRAMEAIQRKRSYPLERAHYLLLRLLEREGPLPIAGLAEELLLDDSTVTRQVATMEQHRLIERLPNPQDGRSVLIRATRHGLATTAQMRDMRLGRIALLFDGWSGKERSSFAAQLTRFNAALRKSLRSPAGH